MKLPVAIRLVILSAPILGLGCSSAPPPTPEAVKTEMQQLDENRERERSNQ